MYSACYIADTMLDAGIYGRKNQEMSGDDAPVEKRE